VEKIGKRVANSIKQLRDQAGLTQEKLAEKAKISLRGLQDIEYKDRDPRIGTLEKLADVLGATLDQIADRGPRPKKTRKVTDMNESDLLEVMRSVKAPELPHNIDLTSATPDQLEAVRLILAHPDRVGRALAQLRRDAPTDSETRALIDKAIGHRAVKKPAG